MYLCNQYILLLKDFILLNIPLLTSIFCGILYLLLLFFYSIRIKCALHIWDIFFFKYVFI